MLKWGTAFGPALHMLLYFYLTALLYFYTLASISILIFSYFLTSKNNSHCNFCSHLVNLCSETRLFPGTN